MDSTVCKELSISDTEVSEITWTDNGTFNLSEGHTPQTENSEGKISYLFQKYLYVGDFPGLNITNDTDRPLHNNKNPAY